MYKVYLNDTLMHDPRIEELALIDPVIELEENKAGSFSFTMPPNHPRYDEIERRKSILSVYQDDELIFCGACIEVEVDFFKQKSVFCEGEMSYLNDSIIRPAKYNFTSVRELLEIYIEKHNEQMEESKQFNVGMVTVADPPSARMCYSNMNSTMECLKEDLVDDFGGFMRIRYESSTRYIDYLANSLNTNSQVIRLGVNLLNFKSNIDSSELATAIIPLGATIQSEEGEQPVQGLETRVTIESVNDGKDYLFSQDAVDTYGWIYKTVTFDDVTQPATLKQKGLEYLQATQFENLVIEASAIDMHIVNSATERFKISDQIRVISEPHGLDKYFRLTKQTINLNHPENDTVTLGKDEKLTLTASSSQIGDAVKKVVAEFVPAPSIVQQANGNTNNMINGNTDAEKIDIEELADEYHAFAEKIMLLPKRFHLTSDTNSYETGFIAREILEALTESGLENSDFKGIKSENGTYSLNYISLIALLFNELKLMDERVKALEEP